MSEEEQEGRKANGPSISVTLKGSSLDRRDIMDSWQYGLVTSQDVPGFPKKVLHRWHEFASRWRFHATSGGPFRETL